MAAGPIGTVPLIVDPTVPLTRGERPVLFWLKFGAIHVHPSRLALLRQWAADGVLPCELP
jgi:hypothetical protein